MDNINKTKINNYFLKKGIEDKTKTIEIKQYEIIIKKKQKKTSLYRGFLAENIKLKEELLEYNKNQIFY